MQEQTTSPLPPDTKVKFKPNTLNFIEALNEILQGNMVTKEDWNDEEIYGFMDRDRDNLMIHRNGKDHQWILSEGDMIGEDYYVIN